MKAMLDPMMVAARTHFRAAKEHTDVAAADWIMASSQGDFTLAIDAWTFHWMMRFPLYYLGSQGIALLAQMLDGYLLRSSSATLGSAVWSWVDL
jgi:hypothetical protein